MLADYKICKESTIDLNSMNPYRLRSRLDIKFKNEILHMEFTCFCCYSILDYKREIFNRRGYPIDCQLLYSDGEGNNILNDDDYESIPILLKIDETKSKKDIMLNISMVLQRRILFQDMIWKILDK